MIAAVRTPTSLGKHLCQGREQGGEHPHRGGLARPVGPEQAEHRALLNPDGYARESDGRSEVLEHALRANGASVGHDMGSESKATIAHPASLAARTRRSDIGAMGHIRLLLPERAAPGPRGLDQRDRLGPGLARRPEGRRGSGRLSLSRSSPTSRAPMLADRWLSTGWGRLPNEPWIAGCDPLQLAPERD